ncbi:hypothetical protein [Streptomyces cellulosae]|uniref:Uncharacterized protein n=1 Tax=Streptomyces cellulosae TaxID=1968 RepID=A0ABW7YHI7_STRCE
MSGPTRHRTARMLVSVPPIRFGSIGTSECTTKWSWTSSYEAVPPTSTGRRSTAPGTTATAS